MVQRSYMGSAKPYKEIGSNVVKVNGETPDANGNVSIDAANINATVAGTTDSVTDHLSTIKNDLGDLGEQVQTIEGKMPTVPSTNGTYVQKAFRTSSGVSYAWVLEQ